MSAIPRTYKVSSKSGFFEPFDYKDDGLGYLDFTLCVDVLPPKVADKLPVKQKVMAGIHRWCYPREDLLVTPEGTDVGFRIRYRRNSSMSYLQAPGYSINLHPCDKAKEVLPPVRKPSKKRVPKTKEVSQAFIDAVEAAEG